MAIVGDTSQTNSSTGVSDYSGYAQPAKKSYNKELSEMAVFDYANKHPNIQTSGASIW